MRGAPLAHHPLRASGATNIVVGRCGGDRFRRLRGLVQPGDQDGTHRGIGDGSDRQGAVAGRFQPVRSELPLQREHAEGRTISLFGVSRGRKGSGGAFSRRTPVAHQAFDECGGVIADPGRAAYEAFRRHTTVALMGVVSRR